jgi:nanoRNase/pAp phosphatase (c-di-AMP/oligoRNAs hydrolase)
VDIDGHKVAIYNTTDNISELGNAFNTTLDIDYSISYFFTNEGELVLSYRGKKGHVHVGDLCKKLGGGGHAAAAGVKLPIEAGLAWLKKIYCQNRIGE